MSILTIFYVVLFLSGIDCSTTTSTSATTTPITTTNPVTSTMTGTSVSSVTAETSTRITIPSTSSNHSTHTEISDVTTTSKTSTEQTTSESTATVTTYSDITTLTQNPQTFSYSTTTNSTQTTDGNKSTQSSATLTLEEKQKRIGITSAVICVGSLILVGIAYLSSFVDKPSDKISRDAIKQFAFAENSRYKYDNDGKIIKDSKPGMDKKISFGDNLSSHVASNLGMNRDAEVAGTSKDYTEMKSINEKYPNTNIENRKKNKDTKSGWDVLSDNPKFFDNYQPRRTKNSIEDGDDKEL